MGLLWQVMGRRAMVQGTGCAPAHLKDREEARVAGTVRQTWGDIKKQVERQPGADAVEPLGSAWRAREGEQAGPDSSIQTGGRWQPGTSRRLRAMAVAWLGLES